MTAPSDIVAQTTTADFLEFIQKVKDNYKTQLANCQLDIDLTFYLWFEGPGELCFNFINSNHHRLPFGCKLKYIDRPEEIVDQYLKSKYHDQVILWDELQTVETPEEIAEADRLEKRITRQFCADSLSRKNQKTTMTDRCSANNMGFASGVLTCKLGALCFS